MTSERPPPGPDIHRLDLEGLSEERFLCRDGEYRIVVEPVAWDAVQAHASENLEHEVCGVLVGELYRDGDGPHLVIKGCIPGRGAHQASDHVTFTHSTWEHIHKEKDEKHPDLRVVGWYHTHPGIGVFLSEPDLFAHRSFFDAAWQVALVVDPKAGREGLFYWEGGEVVRVRRYWVGGEPRWEPPQRPAASAPPGANPGMARRAAEEADPPVAETRWWESPALRAGLWFAVPVLLLVLMFWNASRETARLRSQVDALRRDTRHGAQDASALLARDLALWVRKRLDEGGPPDRFRPVYDEVLTLDPARRGTWRTLLGELAGPEDGD